MLEQIARALHEAHKPYCDYTYPFEHEMSGRAVYEALARAAIKAMHEPTEVMTKAGDAAMHDSELPSSLGWRAMIDAALTEKEPQ